MKRSVHDNFCIFHVPKLSFYMQVMKICLLLTFGSYLVVIKVLRIDLEWGLKYLNADGFIVISGILSLVEDKACYFQKRHLNRICRHCNFQLCFFFSSTTWNNSSAVFADHCFSRISLAFSLLSLKKSVCYGAVKCVFFSFTNI